MLDGAIAKKPCYQMVCTFEARILPSRLMTGTPRYTAVAATIRSGMSGMSSRDTCCIALTTSRVNGASLKTWFGLSKAPPQEVPLHVARPGR